MTHRTILAALSALCCVLAPAGCAVAPEPQAPQETTKFTVENTDRFVPLDAAAGAAVSCTGLQERALADGRLEVVANVKNRDPRAVRVQLQCVFVDALGQPLGAAPPWRILALEGGATEVVRFTALDKAATRYAIRVRTAR